MKQMILVCALATLAGACDREAPSPGPAPTPIALPPPPEPAPPPPIAAPRSITVGEEVEDDVTAGAGPRRFVLTTPRAGTLGVRLTWDDSSGAAVLALALDGTTCDCGDSSPLVARHTVQAGQQIDLDVTNLGSWWDYYVRPQAEAVGHPFVLVATLE